MELSQRRLQLIGRLRYRKTREREGLVLVEGIRAVAEAVAAGAEAVFAVASPRLATLAGGEALLDALTRAGVETARTDDTELAHLADTEHPQGILLVCREPRARPDLVRPGAQLLVLDALQDPGNVGTLVRAATAFALDGVVVLDGTADPWGTKAVRASAGMVFRVPLLQVDWEDALAALRAAGLPLLVADAEGADVGAVPRGEGWALAVGNEGAGPRVAVRHGAAAVVRIPMPGPAESLNAGVAGSILLYALTRS